MSEPAHVHIGDLVRILGLSAPSWRRYAQKRWVRCVRVNGQRIFDLEDCRRFLNEGPPQERTEAPKEMSWREKLRNLRERKMVTS